MKRFLGLLCCVVAVVVFSASKAEALIAFMSKPEMGMGTDAGYEIYVMDNDGTNVRQLTDNDFFDSDPIWSPDGMSLSFYSSRNGNTNGDIFTMNYDGSNEFNVTNDPDTAYYEQDWSPDGQRLVMRSSSSPYAGADLYTINKNGTGLTKINNLPDNPSYPKWSPGGDRVAAYTWSSPEHKVVMIDTDGTDKVELTGAGPEFDWSPDGTKLVYYDEGIWVVNADGTDPQLLFNSGGGYEAIWSPDGTKIAFVSGYETTEVMLAAIYFMDSNGENVTRVTDFMRTPGYLDWSSDQQHLIFTSPDERSYTQIFRLDVASLEVMPLTFVGRNTKPRFSPLLDEEYPAVIPEPVTLLLLGSGFLGLLGVRRRLM